MNPLSEIDKSILPWLGRSMKMIDLHMADCLAANGMELTKVQLLLLILLRRENGQPQNSLAIITNRDKASLARLINTMERKGFVTRTTSESDRRIKHIHLTSLGLETLEKAYPVLLKVISTIQVDIDPDDLEIATQVLKKILANIQSVDAKLTFKNN